MSVMLEIAVK